MSKLAEMPTAPVDIADLATNFLMTHTGSERQYRRAGGKQNATENFLGAIVLYLLAAYVGENKQARIKVKDLRDVVQDTGGLAIDFHERDEVIGLTFITYSDRYYNGRKRYRANRKRHGAVRPDIIENNQR